MTQQINYCLDCKTNTAYELKEHLIKTYKNTEVNINEFIPHCVECGRELFIREIESENLKRLYTKYRKLNSLVEPNEITDFIDKYEISQRTLTSILGWGKMTLNRYINGSIPSKSHSDYLKTLFGDEEKFKEKVEEAYISNRINQKNYKKLTQQYNERIENDYRKNIISQLTHNPSEYNGYRKFDMVRVENLISYIADRVNNLTITSLNKYLWYIDFVYFNRYQRSVTGIQYARYTHGPVIENHVYYKILDISPMYFQEEEEINDCVKISIKSNQNYNMNLYTDKEMSVIDEISDRLSKLSVSQISELSHTENGWLETNDNQLITYEYADKLKHFVD